jgi:hypothetical protein
MRPTTLDIVALASFAKAAHSKKPFGKLTEGLFASASRDSYRLAPVQTDDGFLTVYFASDSKPLRRLPINRFKRRRGGST